MPEIINCPECGYAFELDKAIAKKASAQLEKDFNKRIADAERKIQLESTIEINKLQSQLDQANKKELELLKRKTELEQKAKDIELEVQRKLDEEKQILEARVGDRIAEAHRAKDAEKDRKLADTLAQIEDLKRRMEQGSQQAQGETFEAEMEDLLKAEFPHDQIDAVSPGVKGGDIVQTVITKAGVVCGKILWEFKRTKSWSDGWIAKVKSDGRNIKADVCLIASEVLPKEFVSQNKPFGDFEGVWVSSPVNCISLVHALRGGLIRAAKEKYLQAGKKDNAILVYEYLTGNEFKGRIEAIVESYKTMKSDLDSEKRAMEKVWAKREKQIGLVTSNLAGMYGEIEAIAANELPVIANLEIGGGK